MNVIKLLMKGFISQISFLYKLKKNQTSFSPACDNTCLKEDVHDWIDFAFSSPDCIVKPIQVRLELADFLTIIKHQKPETILEIGSANGGTLFLFSSFAADNAHFICVDLPQIPMKILGKPIAVMRTLFFNAFMKKDQRLNLIWADSHSVNTKNRIKSRLNGKEFDLVFIDGDHSYEGVKRDFELYLPLVKPNGLIVFHDIVFHPPGTVQHPADVDVFWTEIKENFNFLELVQNWNQWWAGLGVVYKERFLGMSTFDTHMFLRHLNTCTLNHPPFPKPLIRCVGKDYLVNNENPSEKNQLEVEELEVCVMLSSSPQFLEFPCPCLEISGIELMFGTYKRTNQGMICLNIWENHADKKHEPDRQVLLDAANLADNQFAAFHFDTLKLTRDRTLLLSLEVKNFCPEFTPGLWYGKFQPPVV